MLRSGFEVIDKLSQARTWVRLPHASAKLLMIRLPLWGPETEKRDHNRGFCSHFVPKFCSEKRPSRVKGGLSRFKDLAAHSKFRVSGSHCSLASADRSS